MGYKNAFDTTGQNQQAGERAENSFEFLAKQKGLKVRRASFRQQLSHIDFLLTNKENKTFFIDVKARKRISRYTDSFTDDLVWIELKNVQGKEGWLYGAADFIAFERENDFVIVPRKNLILICDKLITSKRVEKSTEALYCKFTRKSRKDELSLIKMQDILNGTKVQLWQKQQLPL
jgi:hypothetical protein